MKKVFTIIIAAAAALILSGCVSIPEPSEKTTTMLYGLTEYRGSYDYAVGGYDTKVMKSGIKVVVKNLKTNKSYTITSNSKGEIIKTGIPTGYYYIKEISTEYEYDERTWWTTISPNKGDAAARFQVKEGVTNMGKTTIFSDYSTSSVSVQWNDLYSDAYNFFKERYPESAWLDADWNNL